jgi:hypothetical protein
MRFRLCILTVGLFALALSGCGGCGDDGGFDARRPDSAPTGGTFSLSWSLTDDATHQRVTCDKIDPNATVVIEARHGATSGVEVLSCKPLQGTSLTAFPPGIYSFSYELHMQFNGQTITVATATGQGNVTISSGQNATLDPIEFHVNAVGGLVLMLQAGATGNCAGGAGITGFAISLEHTGDPPDTGCASVVFSLSGGGTYNANDCASPAVTRCIAATETLSVPSMPSGPYQIHIRGKKGTLDCWTNDDSLRVPPQGLTLSRTLNLALSPSCP